MDDGALLREETNYDHKIIYSKGAGKVELRRGGGCLETFRRTSLSNNASMTTRDAGVTRRHVEKVNVTL